MSERGLLLFGKNSCFKAWDLIDSLKSSFVLVIVVGDDSPCILEFFKPNMGVSSKGMSL